jgi:hypothetical protein
MVDDAQTDSKVDKLMCDARNVSKAHYAWTAWIKDYRDATFAQNYTRVIASVLLRDIVNARVLNWFNPMISKHVPVVLEIFVDNAKQIPRSELVNLTFNQRFAMFVLMPSVPHSLLILM